MMKFKFFLILFLLSCFSLVFSADNSVKQKKKPEVSLRGKVLVVINNRLSAKLNLT